MNGGQKAGFTDGSESIIGACIEVHRQLGPGLLESVYELSLCRELELRGMSIERQKSVPLVYKGVELDCGFRLDVLVNGRVLVEVKAVDRLLGVHFAQVLTYLKLAVIDTGLLVNFNEDILKDGVRRLVGRKNRHQPAIDSE